MTKQERELFLSQTDAIRGLIHSSSAPFIIQAANKDPELFTGNFMSFEGRYFVITAGHPFFDNMGHDIKIHTRTDPNRKNFETIGPCQISVPDNEAVDVGIVELHDGETIRKLQNNYTFLTISNVTKILRRSSTVMVGFPVATARDNPNKDFDPRPLFIKTELLESDPPPGIKRIEGLDYFFLFDKMASDLNLDLVPTVELPGISGAAVWQYRDCEDIIWSPNKSFKIVGIQVAVADNKSYLRVINWWAVAQSLKGIDPKLGVVMEKYLENLDG